MRLLAPDDVVIDGGNSSSGDTERREAALRARGLHFVGMGCPAVKRVRAMARR